MTGSFDLQLRRYRLRAGVTQDELARRSEASVRTVSGLETGRHAPWPPRRANTDVLGLAAAERDELLAAATG
ncbi:helix-turn-helix transcriptional regulator [Solihabitans fulvus]|uniref:Helix-turn-helix transcriptional regulator n=1 Tax=Solihabitans fulvus TaxID=1892852 RepID=A0A5B2W983_9PSEU|nr:helix-turn-helix transcriptional regulator [Solihabitans fulvus]KAA2247300.1 helix-turn-helix transcriptional regulator [Solihabitans fulvus]